MNSKMLRKEKLIEGRAPHVYVASYIAEIADEKSPLYEE